jgi:outer membrane immunogenic protein
MRRLILGITIAAFGPGSAAFAADIPVKAPLPPNSAAWSWNGCYLGANAGVDQGRHYTNLSPSGLYLTPPGGFAPPNANGTGDFPADLSALSTQYSSTNYGLEGGLQVGCNRQVGVLVFGVEADGQWSGERSTLDAAFAAFPDVGNPFFTVAARTERVDVSKKWFGTARGRLGFTPWDRVLLYGTAGVAFANYQANTAVTFATVPVNGVYSGAVQIGSTSSTQFGGVVGAGVEWAFMANWTAKIEYLYMWFNGFSYASPMVAAAVAAAPGYSWNTTISPREQVIRVGVNYKF